MMSSKLQIKPSKENQGCLTILKNFVVSFFIGYSIPANLYTTDFRLMFILTAIYTSLVSQFRQAGNKEAEVDIASGRLFRINSIWTNYSVSGGMSDRILWNCRSDSSTAAYYKTLYLGLICLYCTIVAIYFIASMIINSMVAYTVSKLKIKAKKETENAEENDHEYEEVNYLELVQTEVKKSYRLREKIKALKHKSLQRGSIENLQEEISTINTWLDQMYDFKKTERFYNLFTILYIIPRFETIIMFCILSLALTSYDIHPIGCLSPISVLYNETNSSVALIISESVILYQRVSMVLIMFLAIIWFSLKLFQFFLLPRLKWGIQIHNKPCFCTCYGCRNTIEQPYTIESEA